MTASKRTYEPLTDKTPKYTVKEVAKMLDMTTYTVRYYDNSGLIPNVDRTDSNIRMFSDYAVNWLRLVHCLRTTGLPIAKIRNYIDMCLEGDSTIPKRAELILQQEKNLRKQIKDLQRQMEVLKYKKAYYLDLLETHKKDDWNPMNRLNKAEPNITPLEKCEQ
jgi:DNA-binding transcriptional MerR regulator